MEMWAAGPPPESSPPRKSAVTKRYPGPGRDKSPRLYGSSMEVYITAKPPKLDKQGRLHALRHISKVGFVTYEVLEFEGDKTIKSSVIARYLAAEAQSRADTDTSFDITPAYYNFKYTAFTESTI